MLMVAEDLHVSSPDGDLKVTLSDNDGKLTYTVTYKEHSIIEPSPLGFIANVGDYTQGAKLVNHETRVRDECFSKTENLRWTAILPQARENIYSKTFR